jgi:sugar lactone lactonase YvrE
MLTCRPVFFKLAWTQGLPRPSASFVGQVGNPYGLAFDSTGNLFVADGANGKIYKVTSDGTRTTFASGFNWPWGLAFDGSGKLFEADYLSGNVYKFTPDGNHSTFASGLQAPSGLAFATVPESSTFVLLTTGAVSLLAYVWQKRRVA